MHGPIRDSWPMAFFDCPRGHRVDSETRVFSSTGLTSPVATSPRNRASQEPMAIAEKWFPGMEQTLRQRRSSCLWFQIVGVETYLLLPDDQRDRGNLPRQGQACHRGLPPLSQQSLVEIVQRPTAAANSRCCSLENIFEVMVVVLI